MTDPAKELRKLADDLADDAQQLDPTDPAQGGLQQGLGRAAGKAQERARRLERLGP